MKYLHCEVLFFDIWRCIYSQRISLHPRSVYNDLLYIDISFLPCCIMLGLHFLCSLFELNIVILQYKMGSIHQTAVPCHFCGVGELSACITLRGSITKYRKS
ncbi:hypothetical protein GDO81_003280 [Engystomops pustulosus]|uniref:Uncharacterized protein n=1 Tax=Engystomops pustulosus TaxID=76066 RepID=A0AAV6ZUY1_ENGPU|nr:hypothetical protein GDO81_003280 [Engystomops pustulosus]